MRNALPGLDQSFTRPGTSAWSLIIPVYCLGLLMGMRASREKCCCGRSKRLEELPWDSDLTLKHHCVKDKFLMLLVLILLDKESARIAGDQTEVVSGWSWDVSPRMLSRRPGVRNPRDVGDVLSTILDIM